MSASELRFLFASYPEIMGKVLGIVNRALSTHLIHKAEFTRTDAQTGAVTLIQRFGSALGTEIKTCIHRFLVPDKT